MPLILSFLCPTTNTDESQTLAPEVKRQPEKAVTGLPTFINVAVLEQKHPNMSFYPINYPPLKGVALWRAMLRFCSNDPNNGAVITRAKRDKRAGKGNILLRQVCRVWTFNWFPFFLVFIVTTFMLHLLSFLIASFGILRQEKGPLFVVEWLESTYDSLHFPYDYQLAHLEGWTPGSTFKLQKVSIFSIFKCFSSKLLRR